MILIESKRDSYHPGKVLNTIIGTNYIKYLSGNSYVVILTKEDDPTKISINPHVKGTIDLVKNQIVNVTQFTKDGKRMRKTTREDLPLRRGQLFEGCGKEYLELMYEFTNINVTFFIVNPNDDLICQLEHVVET
jgi:hypothetical protein